MPFSKAFEYHHRNKAAIHSISFSFGSYSANIYKNVSGLLVRPILGRYKLRIHPDPSSYPSPSHSKLRNL